MSQHTLVISDRVHQLLAAWGCRRVEPGPERKLQPELLFRSTMPPHSQEDPGQKCQHPEPEAEQASVTMAWWGLFITVTEK